MQQSEIIERISELKRSRKAIILAHTYTLPEVQEIADFVGDSYGLSKKAAKIGDCETIVFAGVRFMAETAKILSPEKRVLLPAPTAGCRMADMIDGPSLAALKAEHPNATVVCYVNSTVEIKALSDVCVTSSNAVKIVGRIENDEILFVPDKNLGGFVAEHYPDKRFIFWDGFCPVHNFIDPAEVLALKSEHPDAKVLMHPECAPESRELADYLISTGQMVDLVAEKRFKKYIIITESGIMHALHLADPNAEFYSLPPKDLLCPNMKKINLQNILEALEELKHEVRVDGDIRVKALKSLEKMLELAG